MKLSTKPPTQIIIILIICLYSTLALAVDTTFVSVVKVQIEGNKRTKNFIIERELDIKTGVKILKSELQERLLQNQKRISNTTLFSEVIVAYTSAIDNEINILITVKENWYLWAFPYASFNDRNFNEWRNRGSDFGRLNYGFFVDHKNFLGRMQKLEFVFETGFTNRVTLKYDIPYLNKSGKNGLYSEFKYQNLANLNYTTKNNQLEFAYADEQLKTQFEGKVKYRYREGFYHFHYAEVGYNTSSISDSLFTLNNNFLSNQSKEQKFASLAYTYRYDKRDNINFPLKGKALIADVRKYGLLPSDNFNSWQFKLAFADYYPLKKKWYFNYIIKASAFTNPDVPYNLLRGIGYDENILRGYDLFVVNGSAYVSGRLNIKNQLFSKTYNLKFIKSRQFNTLPINFFVNAFLDAGYVHNKFPERINNDLTNSRLTSYGIGLELNAAYNSVIRFNMSRSALNQTNFFINLQKDIWTKWF